MSYLPDWSTEDEDLTRTRKWDGGDRFEREITDVIVHPSFAAESVTEEMPIPAWVQPTLPPPPAAAESFPSASGAFASAPNLPRLHSEPRLSVGRTPFDSDTSVSTWKKTVPALRQMMGLPIVPGWRPTPVPRPRLLEPSAPPPPSPARLTPVLSIAMAVCLVAMVLMAIVGLGSRAREASRLAHTRVVSAVAPDGAAVTNGRVFVDGSAECDGTPCELELTPGVHWITVRAVGFDTPPSRSVHAGREGEPTQVAFELVPSRDGPPTAVAAPAPAPLPPVALAAVAVPAPSTEAPVAAGRTESPRPSMVRPTLLGARLNVNSIPASTVVVDGRPVGQTPVMGLKVKPGPHTVVLIGPEGKRAVRSASAVAGKTATVAVRF
jgi:hypothetical protein